MNTLIVGSSGKIGKFFFKIKKKNFFFTYFKKKIKNGIKFDLTKDDINLIIDKYNIKKIIFLSAITDPDICAKNKTLSRNVNVNMTKKIIDKIIQRNIYFIFISSEFIYCGKKKNYKENSLAKPVNLYGKQKLIIEKYLTKKYKNFCILRIAKTYSDELEDKTLLTGYIRNILSNKKKFYASKNQIFNPLYVYDLIKIITFFLIKNKKGVFNVGGPKAYSRFEILRIVLNKINEKMIKNFNPAIKDVDLNSLMLIDKRPLNVSFNISKLKKNINFNLTSINTVLDNIIKKNYASKFKKR